MVPNERFCIGFDDNRQVLMRMNNGGYNGLNYRVYFGMAGCKIDYGWNFLTVTFTPSGGNTNLRCWAETDAGQSTSDTATFGNTINDDPANGGYLCTGGSVHVDGYRISNFVGITNRVQYFYGTALTQAQHQTLYSTDCESWCRICIDRGSSPNMCHQQKPMANLQVNYDFMQDQYPASQVQLDMGQRSYNLDVNSDFSRTPAYAHKQGLWVDRSFATQNQYMDSISSSAFLSEQRSFTIEAWIRPTVAPAANSMIYEKYSTAGSSYLGLGFSSGNTLMCLFMGLSRTYNVGAALVVNQWNYIALTVVKITNSQSKLCLTANQLTPSCQTVNQIFADSGSSKARVGNGYTGFIKSVEITDYSKEALDLRKMTQTTGCTANTNGNSCARCPALTGECLNDCDYDQYVNITTGGCTACYASCRTCWDASNNNCYSCPSGPQSWVYNYVDTCTTLCGDGYRDDFEECDDDNIADNDGCSSTCNLENGYDCMKGSFLQQDTCYQICGSGIPPTGGCDDLNFENGDGCSSNCKIELGWQCSGTPSVCTTICGDGRKTGSEECDDQNVSSGDGCSSTCIIESGYQCTGGSIITKDVCQEICGDSKNVGKFQCDDGNTINFDGCDSKCKIEVGFTCSGGSPTAKDSCAEICGDGRNILKLTNQCDDGNTANGDGCSSSCQIETGYACQGGSSYTKDTCSEICGDGKVMGQNKCDDGNTDSGDGCHSDCTIEIGYQCTGGSPTSSDTCSEICGDGKNYGTHQCDDGNAINGDGCSSTCTQEPYYICTKGDPFTKSECKKTCDGIRDSFDMCDDGNQDSGDGCDQCCHREIGFSCTGGTLSSTDTCSETCGDGRNLNYLPCDDGNTVNGDGCSSTCQIENGFTCQTGSIYFPSICYEVCGDGKNMGKFQCDDGNVQAGDGCSSTCYVEQGFSCTTGNSTKPSICQEVCGDGKNMKSYADSCDDGNTISGDGCSNKCLIESGFDCSQGSSLTPDICIEICGDGFNKGQNPCDDGNLVDGDGCSRTCQIERGYQCDGGSPISQDICTSLSAPFIKEAYINDFNTQIFITFNDTVSMNYGFNTDNSQHWSLELHGPLGINNYDFRWNITRQGLYKNKQLNGTQVIIVDFMCQNQLFGSGYERIIFNFNDRSQIRSFDTGTVMVNTSLIIFPNGQDDKTYLNSEGMFPEMIDTLTTSLVISSFGMGVLGSLFGYSMQDVWIMMQTLQQMYLMPCNNLFIPTSTTDYALSFKYAMPTSDLLSYLSLGGATNYSYVEKAYPPAHFGYKKMGFKSNVLLQNCAEVFSIGVYMYLIKIVADIILFYTKRQQLINSLIRLKSTLWTGFVSLVYMKISFCSHLNLKHMSFDEGQMSISSLMSLFFVIGSWLFIPYLIYKGIMFHLKSQKLLSIKKNLSEEKLRDFINYEGNILFQDYALKSFAYPLTIFYPALNYFRMLLTAVLIVSDDSVAQLQGLVIINLLILTATLVIRPYEYPLLNLQQVIGDTAVFLIYIQAHQFIPKPTLEVQQQAEMSKLLVGLMFSAIVVNSMIVIFSKLIQITKCKSVARPLLPQIKIDLSTKKQVQTKSKTLRDQRKPDNKNSKQQLDKSNPSNNQVQQTRDENLALQKKQERNQKSMSSEEFSESNESESERESLSQSQSYSESGSYSSENKYSEEDLSGQSRSNESEPSFESARSEEQEVKVAKKFQKRK